MSRYDYRCESCGECFEVMKSMKDSDTPEACPECGSPAKKLISCPTVYADGMVRVSYALGVHPKQIPEARKIHPGAEFTPEGHMIIHNRAEKLRRLKERTKATGVQWDEKE